MRTLLLFVVLIGLSHADTIFNVSASADGQDCNVSSATNAYCDVPQPISVWPSYYGPQAQSYFQILENQPINGGPDSENMIQMGGLMTAEGNRQPGETTSGPAAARISINFAIPEFWTNVYFYGGFNYEGYTPSQPLTLMAGDQALYFTNVAVNNEWPPSPHEVIYHTAGMPESITFDQSVTADQYNQIVQFGFGFTVINAAAVPEPASVGFLAATLTLLGVAIGVKKVRA